MVSKDQARYHISHIFADKKNKCLVSTNGKILAKVWGEVIEQNIAELPDFILPKRVLKTKFVFEAVNEGIKYPDYNKVLESAGERDEGTIVKPTSITHYVAHAMKKAFLFDYKLVEKSYLPLMNSICYQKAAKDPERSPLLITQKRNLGQPKRPYIPLEAQVMIMPLRFD